MAKKIRPSLKDYLRTGVVRFTEDHPSAATEERESALPKNSAMILDLLSERDRRTWEPIFNAGTEVRVASLDLIALREEFRNADRNRYTYYLLADGEDHLRPVRTSVQIREPVKGLLKWDETGVLTFYRQP